MELCCGMLLLHEMYLICVPKHVFRSMSLFTQTVYIGIIKKIFFSCLIRATHGTHDLSTEEIIKHYGPKREWKHFNSLNTSFTRSGIKYTYIYIYIYVFHLCHRCYFLSCRLMCIILDSSGLCSKILFL